LAQTTAERSKSAEGSDVVGAASHIGWVSILVSKGDSAPKMLPSRVAYVSIATDQLLRSLTKRGTL
jgi:hypothetical protein